MKYQKINNFIRHIENWEGHHLVRDVIRSNRKFEKEVEDFYDLRTYWESIGGHGGIFRKFDFKPEDTKKSGTTPKDLISILNGFEEETFDMNRLSYNAVREDYRIWNNLFRKTAKMTLGFSSLAVGLFGGFLAAVLENFYLGVPLAIVGFSSHYWTVFNYPDPKDTNGGLNEYIRLHESAEIADSFIERYYKRYFINKELSDK